MSNIRLIHNDIKIERLRAEVYELLDKHQVNNNKQLSLSSSNGDDNWYDGVGHPKGKPYLFNKLNNSLKGTYIGELVSRYEKYYRWRLLILPPVDCYSIHQDVGDDRNLKYHYRLHIPVVTNVESLVLFFNHEMVNNSKGYAEYHNLLPGNSYLFNAGNFHTAINGNRNQTRIHLVGQVSK